MRNLRPRIILAVLIVIVTVAGLGYWAKENRPLEDLPVSSGRTGGAATGKDKKSFQPIQQNDSSAQNVAVTTSEVRISRLPVRQSAIGWVEAVAIVEIKSRMDGVIAKQLVKDGQFVKEGDTLFQLDDAELLATIARDEATLAKDEAVLVRANADLKRTKSLVAKSAAAAQQLDLHTAEAKSAEANVAVDKAVLLADHLRLDYTNIKAPIDGRLGAVTGTPGNLVKVNDTTLTVITLMNPIRVRFALPEENLNTLQDALKTATPGAVRVFTREGEKPRAEGKLIFINSAIDSSSGTVTAKAEFDNTELALWPGEFVNVEIELGQLPELAIIPTVAIQTGQQGSYVLVVKPDETISVRIVNIVGSERDRTAVSGDLKAGEHVVVEGQSRLVEGTKVDASPAQIKETAYGNRS